MNKQCRFDDEYMERFQAGSFKYRRMWWTTPDATDYMQQQELHAQVRAAEEAAAATAEAEAAAAAAAAATAAAAAELEGEDMGNNEPEDADTEAGVGMELD